MDPFSLLTAAAILAVPVPIAPTDLLLNNPNVPPTTTLILGIAQDADAEEPVVEEKSPWTGTIGMGLTASRTDTNTLGFNFNASASRADELFNWNSNLKYIYNKDDGSIQDNFFILQTEYDQLFEKGSAWNWFAQGSYQYNETEIYRQRLKAFAGPGYFLSRTDDLTWNLKAGAGTTWDDQGSENGWTTRSVAGTNWKWQIRKGINFQGSVEIQNSIQDFDSYLAVLELRVNVALEMMENLNLYFSLRDEYDSSPGAGGTWNSMWITMGFSYGF
jgi:hypothetical protein